MATVSRTALTAVAVSLVLAVAVVAASACTAFETNLQDTDVDYAQTAKANFDQGEQAFADGRFTEAVKFFEHTKNKFPYSKFAVQAELRTADAHFAREKWLEAADAYKIFCRFHPRDEKVAYATYRVALAYAKEIDQDVWWMPSAVERDQSAARDAIRAFDEYLARFPDDENAAEAKKLRVDARARLADADLYAARFYEEREKWKGAMWRYQRVANEYGDTPGAAAALLRAAQLADDQLADAAAATLLYEQLVREHPAAPEATDAKRALAARSKSPGTPPSPLPATTPTPAS
ncbi:MAG: outer membrane protein assembly factor BamD [Deltaproteobacteria bacterium]|nr:outer membrane protein assembly factor BamD [Deltaproteobacteria bacterium]